MYQTWSWLSFLHCLSSRGCAAAAADRLRPHTFDGRAWVGVTLFLLEDLRTPVAPALPWFTSFPETNVRTYVAGPDGREGLWFFSLDAGRLEPVLVARSTVEHEPWPLHRAAVHRLDTNLLAAAGLPAPSGDPVVHWSPGVRTRISGLRPLG